MSITKRKRIIILVMLVAAICILFPLSTQKTNFWKSERGMAMSNLYALATAIEAYYEEHKRYPDSPNALPSSPGFAHWGRSGYTRFSYSINLIPPDDYKLIAIHKETGKSYTLTHDVFQKSKSQNPK